MDGRTIADNYFIRNTEFKIAICRQCEYAVKPREIIRHLTNPNGTYRINQAVAEQIFHIIDDQWIDMDDDHTTFPIVVQKPILGLTIYQDGLLCSMCP